jgi:hypothetical protein
VSQKTLSLGRLSSLQKPLFKKLLFKKQASANIKRNRPTTNDKGHLIKRWPLFLHQGADFISRNLIQGQSPSSINNPQKNCKKIKSSPWKTKSFHPKTTYTCSMKTKLSHLPQVFWLMPTGIFFNCTAVATSRGISLQENPCGQPQETADLDSLGLTFIRELKVTAGARCERQAGGQNGMNNVTATQGLSFTLSGSVSGATPICQWYKTGAAIGSATAALYTKSAGMSAAGNNCVKITNSSGTVTSNTMALTGTPSGGSGGSSPGGGGGGGGGAPSLLFPQRQHLNSPSSIPHALHQESAGKITTVVLFHQKHHGFPYANRQSNRRHDNSCPDKTTLENLFEEKTKCIFFRKRHMNTSASNNEKVDFFNKVTSASTKYEMGRALDRNRILQRLNSMASLSGDDKMSTQKMTPVEAALQIADFKKGVSNPHTTREAIEVTRQVNKEFALEALRILAAEVRRLRESSQWRPIETAPKFAIAAPTTGIASTLANPASKEITNNISAKTKKR